MIDIPTTHHLPTATDPDFATLERELKAECAAKHEALKQCAFIELDSDPKKNRYCCPHCYRGTREGRISEAMERIEHKPECPVGRALSSNAGADLLAKAQSAARLAEALRKVKAVTDQFNDAGSSMWQIGLIVAAALREFEQTTISPNQQNT